MSLLDVSLLDPYRINVWIAYRMDGLARRGTQNDPYDGSTDFAAPVSVATLVNVGGGQEATATTAPAHGYSTNDVVNIEKACLLKHP